MRMENEFARAHSSAQHRHERISYLIPGKGSNTQSHPGVGAEMIL